MEIKIISTFRQYFLIFFIFGQTFWNASVIACGMFRINRIIPSLLFLATSIICTSTTIVHFHKLGSEQARTGGNIICVAHFLRLLFAIFVVWRTVFYSNEISQLIELIERTIDHLQQSTHTDLKRELAMFKRVYHKKFIILISVCVVAFVVKLLTHPMLLDRPLHINVFTSLSNLFNSLARAHVLLYVDLMLWCYQINADQIKLDETKYDLDMVYRDVDDDDKYNIKNQLKLTINVDEYINRLRHCKYIHFKLWEITRLINAHFGWVLTITLLNSFMEGLIAAFWAFLHMRSGKYRDLIRKYSRRRTVFCMFD